MRIMNGHCVLKITIDNEYGTKNNLVRVKATDFEVFDALDMDSKDLESDLRSNVNFLYIKLCTFCCSF